MFQNISGKIPKKFRNISGKFPECLQPEPALIVVNFIEHCPNMIGLTNIGVKQNALELILVEFF